MGLFGPIASIENIISYLNDIQIIFGEPLIHEKTCYFYDNSHEKKKKVFILFDLKAINFDLVFLGWIYFSQ